MCTSEYTGVMVCVDLHIYIHMHTCISAHTLFTAPDKGMRTWSETPRGEPARRVSKKILANVVPGVSYDRSSALLGEQSLLAIESKIARKPRVWVTVQGKLIGHAGASREAVLWVVCVCMYVFMCACVHA
jgi:hypothetical protein